MRRIPRSLSSASGRLASSSTARWSCNRALQYRAAIRTLSTSVEPATQSDRPTQTQTSETYVPAETAEGLEWIGSEEWVRARKEEERNLQSEIPRFLKAREVSEDELETIFKRALAEVLLLKATLGEGMNTIRAGVEKHIQDIHLQADNGGSVITVDFKDAKILEETAPSLQSQDRSGKSVRVVLAKEELQRLSFHSWQVAALTNPTLKFAFVKRIMELTGTRIPDPIINSTVRVGHLWRHLRKAPATPKLADALLESQKQHRLSNVTVYNKQKTLEEEESKLGRWKVIEDALMERNLPIHMRDAYR